jgi:hypothetical protein
MMEGMNLTIIYYNYFSKCYNVPPVQQYYDNKNTQIKEKKMS